MNAPNPEPNVLDAIQWIVEQIEGLRKGVGQLAGHLGEGIKAFSSAMEPFAWRLHEWFEALPEWEKEVASRMAQRGWYLDPNMGIVAINEIVDALSEDASVERIERELCEHYTARLSRVEEDLRSWHPTRSDLIRQAFEAHRLGLYAASVPLVLAQADGLAHDFTGGKEQLYKRAGKNLEAYLENALEGRAVKTGLLTAITTESTLTLNENARGTEFQKTGLLNRHAVIHGEDITYATELNALRAVSFLYFVAWMLHDLRQDESVLLSGQTGTTHSEGSMAHE